MYEGTLSRRMDGNKITNHSKKHQKMGAINCSHFHSRTAFSGSRKLLIESARGAVFGHYLPVHF